VLEKVYQAVRAALAEKDVFQRLDEFGFVASGEPPEKFLADAKAEASIWAETILRGNLAVE
jgi:hypothetical protein